MQSGDIYKLDTRLAAHIATLKKEEATTPIASKNKAALLFVGTQADKGYLTNLKPCVGGCSVAIYITKIETLMQVAMHCQKRGITKIISTSTELLTKLLHWDKKAAPKLQAYVGSYFKIHSVTPGGAEIEVVFIPPLKQLITVPYAQFITKRMIRKLTQPNSWYMPTEFSWKLLTPENETLYFEQASKAFMVSIDIETFRANATIRCISYTVFISSSSGAINSFSLVLSLDSEYALAIMRKWNWQLKAPKVFQGGKYDIAYLTRYNAPVYNYIYDTAHLFHSWYSELPKDLGFLNSFFIREATYWKDLAETNDLYEYYKYNALDSWGTGNTFLAMVMEAPDWAIKNYLKEFPLVFPCHLAEMTGIKRDISKLKMARSEQEQIINESSASLNKILGIPEGQSFNVKSPKQMKALLKILGCGDLKSAEENSLKKARFRHPFNARIINLVLDIRKARTLLEKYLQVGDKAKEFNAGIDGTRGGNRILYSLKPEGTDTSRLAAREHHFWTGLQIQNQPRGSAVKQTYISDPGFYFAECDLEQAESRDTAYIVGEEALIDSVENSPDFHCANASRFFGIPFEKLYDAETHTKLNVPIRDLAKNVNHGANYNMGAAVLIETMGEDNISKAKRLLGLNKFWSYKQVAEYLLEQFHKAYPGIAQVYYKGVIKEILVTNKLVHHTLPEEGWTRYCFGNPDKNKRHLNAYVAHPPQSLNAQTLNKAWLAVFFDIAMHPKHSKNFKLCAQIHDSILFQYRKGHEYLCDMVKELMEIPVTIKGYDGKVRTFTVPAAIKKGKEGKPAKYWSDTE